MSKGHTVWIGAKAKAVYRIGAMREASPSFRPRDWAKAQAIGARPVKPWPQAPDSWRETRPQHIQRAEAQARISKAIGASVILSKAEAKALEAQGFAVAPRADVEATAYSLQPKIQCSRKAKLRLRVEAHKRAKAQAQALEAQARIDRAKPEAPRPEAPRPQALASWYEPIRLIRQSQALLEADDRRLRAEAQALEAQAWRQSHPASIPVRLKPEAKAPRAEAPRPEPEPVFIPLEAWRYVIRAEALARETQRARAKAEARVRPEASSLAPVGQSSGPEPQPLAHSAKPLGAKATLYGSTVEWTQRFKPQAQAPKAVGILRKAKAQD